MSDLLFAQVGVLFGSTLLFKRSLQYFSQDDVLKNNVLRLVNLSENTAMTSSRFLKCGALFALSLGLVLLAGFDDLLAAGKADEAKKYLETLKKSKVAKERAEAATELGKIGEVNFKYAEPAIEALTGALDDKEATVRAASAVALGKIGPDDKKALVTKLRELLKDDKEETVKLAATQALGYLGKDATEAIKDLREVKKDLADQKGKFSKAIDAAIRTIQPPQKKK